LPTDDPILELFGADVFARFKRSLEVHEALRAAFKERTGTELQPDSDYTLADVRRADRILKAGGHPGIGC
jgi:hypothetical protein